VALSSPSSSVSSNELDSLPSIDEIIAEPQRHFPRFLFGEFLPIAKMPFEFKKTPIHWPLWSCFLPCFFAPPIGAIRRSLSAFGVGRI
jgi:hypothetical protein